MDNLDTYGFLELQSIQNSRNKKIDCQTYIQRWIQTSGKKDFIFLLL